MRKLVITQTKENNAKEAVPTAVINKLYTIGKLDDTNHTFTYGVDTSNVKRPITTVSGAIIIPVAYMGRLEYVRAKYPNLDITANAIYIDFEDSNVELKLLNAGIGDGTGITVEDASTTSLMMSNFFKNDTSIQRFNEFKYFTKSNTSTSGLVGLFLNATSLTQIDLSELVVLHRDEFRNTRITTINAPKLSTLGTNSGDSAFSNNPSLLTVQSLGTISEIPRACFADCTNLQSATLPDDCIILNVDAFKNDQSLTTLLINNPLNITQIGTSCFNGCSNLELDISGFTGILTLGESCFYNCNKVVGIINMPNYSASRFTGFGRTKISKALCMGIASLVDSLNASSEANAALTEVYLPYECTSISVSAFQNLALLNTVKLYSKTVSEWQEGETQTYMSDLSKITFFGNNSFERCRILPLTTADIRNATTIGSRAFLYSLLSGVLSIPNITDLRDYVFGYTHITSVTNLGNTITEIKLNVFEGCTNLTSVTLPSNVKTLGVNAFKGCTNLTTINLSNILTLSGAGTFEGAGLTGAIDLSSLLGSLGSTIFKNCTGITSITSLGSVVSICPTAGMGNSAGTFYGCTSLTSVTFPSTLTTLGNGAFENCTSLSLVLGFENLISIGSFGFSKHAAWEYIVNCSNLTSLGSNSFGARAGLRVRQLYTPKVTEGAQSSYYINDVYYRGSYSGMIIDIIYLRDMEVLRPGSFCNTTCDSLVINNITPPRWEFDSNPSSESDNMKTFASSNITNIYVPDSAVSTYTSDSNWSTLASKIKPLSLLTKVATEADLQQGQIALIEAYM